MNYENRKQLNTQHIKLKTYLNLIAFTGVIRVIT